MQGDNANKVDFGKIEAETKSLKEELGMS